MSDYRDALKRLTKDERIVIAHIQELIGDLKGVRLATVFKGQEAVIAAEIEKEVMAHLMPNFVAEIQRERSKIDLLLNQVNSQIETMSKERVSLNRAIEKFESRMEILRHVQALSTEGKVKIILPTEEELKTP